MEEQQNTVPAEPSKTTGPKHDYWTEPAKVDHKWRTTKHHGPDGKNLGFQEFGSKSEALFFLKEINVYVDGKLCYTGI